MEQNIHQGGVKPANSLEWPIWRPQSNLVLCKLLCGSEWFRFWCQDNLTSGYKASREQRSSILKASKLTCKSDSFFQHWYLNPSNTAPRVGINTPPPRRWLRNANSFPEREILRNNPWFSPNYLGLKFVVNMNCLIVCLLSQGYAYCWQHLGFSKTQFPFVGCRSCQILPSLTLMMVSNLTLQHQRSPIKAL